MTRTHLMAAGILLFVAVTLVAAADSVAKNSSMATGTRVVTTADTAPLASSDHGIPIPTNQFTHVALALSCATGAATGKVTIVWGSIDGNGRFVAMAAETSSTLTAASTSALSNGYYHAGKVSFETTGYTHFVALVTTISAGNAEVRWTVY